MPKMSLKMREIGFQRTYIFKIFRGSMPPDPPRKVRLRRTITFLITYEHPLENLSYAPALVELNWCEQFGDTKKTLKICCLAPAPHHHRSFRFVDRTRAARKCTRTKIARASVQKYCFSMLNMHVFAILDAVLVVAA